MQLNYTSSQSILYLTSTTKVICAKLCKQSREGLRKVYSGQWFRQGSLAVGHLICNHFSKCFKKSGSRKVVREQWFEKSGSRKVVDQKTRWIYTINHIFSGQRKVFDQKKKSEFAEPLFQTFLEKWLQIKCASLNAGSGLCTCLNDCAARADT